MLTYETRAMLARIGVICSNLSIAMLLCGTLFVFSVFSVGVLLVFGMILWVMAMLVTCLILLANETFRQFPKKLIELSDSFSVYGELMSAAVPYLFFIGLVLALLSPFLLALEPSSKKHTARILFPIVMVLFAGAVLLLAKLVDMGVIAP